MSYLDTVPFEESEQATPVQLFELHDYVKLKNRNDMAFVRLYCHLDEVGTVNPTVDSKYFSSLARYLIPHDKGEKVLIPLFRGHTGRWVFAAYGPHPRPAVEEEKPLPEDAKSGIRVTLDADVGALLRKQANEQRITNSKVVNNILRKHYAI